MVSAWKEKFGKCRQPLTIPTTASVQASDEADSILGLVLHFNSLDESFSISCRISAMRSYIAVVSTIPLRLDTMLRACTPFTFAPSSNLRLYAPLSLAVMDMIVFVPY